MGGDDEIVVVDSTRLDRQVGGWMRPSRNRAGKGREEEEMMVTSD